jgi:hypothetical protein
VTRPWLGFSHPNLGIISMRARAESQEPHLLEMLLTQIISFSIVSHIALLSNFLNHKIPPANIHHVFSQKVQILPNSICARLVDGTPTSEGGMDAGGGRPIT